MADLLGNPDRLEARQESAPSSVSLFDATAETIAYESGRNVAQVRAEIKHPQVGGTVWGFDVAGNYRVISK